MKYIEDNFSINISEFVGFLKIIFYFSSNSMNIF